MPLYEYHCPTCNHKFDKLQSMNASGADCPNCEQPASESSPFLPPCPAESPATPDSTHCRRWVVGDVAVVVAAADINR